MDYIKEIQDLANNHTEEQFKQSGILLNVLFVNPELTGNNFYRMILPYVLMNQMVRNTQDEGKQPFRAAFLKLRSYNPQEKYQPIADIETSSTSIVWASTIVFPFTTGSIVEQIKEIRMINPKVHIVQTIDFDFFHLPKNHLLNSEFTEAVIKTCALNCAEVDQIIINNPRMEEGLIEGLHSLDLEVKSEIRTFFLNAIPHYQTAQKDAFDPDPDQPFRIVVLANNYQLDDLRELVPDLKRISGKYGNKIQIVIHGIHSSRRHASADIVEEFESIGKISPPVNIQKYYQALSYLDANLFVIPRRFTKWNEANDDIKRWIDASLLGVPVITPNLFPFSKVIIPNTGFLYEKPGNEQDFCAVIDSILENTEISEIAGTHAKRLLDNQYSVHDEFSVNKMVESFMKTPVNRTVQENISEE